MSDPDVPVSISWDDVVELMIGQLAEIQKTMESEITPELVKWHESERSWERNVLRSSAFRKAFEGIPEFDLNDLWSQAMDVMLCLGNIKNAVAYRSKPRALLDPVKLLETERRRAIEYLRKAASLFSPKGRNTYGDPTEKYWSEISSLISRIEGEPYPQTEPQALGSSFDPSNLRRKGKAASNPESAFNGWMVRELARYVPKNAPKRATAISDLLSLVDVHVEPPSVTTILAAK